MKKSRWIVSIFLGGIIMVGTLLGCKKAEKNRPEPAVPEFKSLAPEAGVQGAAAPELPPPPPPPSTGLAPLAPSGGSIVPPAFPPLAPSLAPKPASPPPLPTATGIPNVPSW